MKKLIATIALFIVFGLSARAQGGNKLDDAVRNWRNTNFSGYREHWDDWTQYMPGVILLGFKLGGMRGRSNWWGTLAVSGMTTLFVVGAVNLTLKPLVQRWRPDNSDTRSFPSGHTATAFAMATLLSKEYGRRNRWIAVGGYTIATATALGRIINNKHWVTDTFAGAAIGILAVELSYLLTDWIFQSRNRYRVKKFDIKEGSE